MKDAVGNEVKEGDKVAYIKAQSTKSLKVGTVRKITKNGILVGGVYPLFRFPQMFVVM